MHTQLKMVEVTIDLTVLKTVASALYYKTIPIIINIILFFYRISRCIFCYYITLILSIIASRLETTCGDLVEVNIIKFLLMKQNNKKYASLYYLMISTLCNVQQTCAVDLGVSNMKALTFSVS